MCLEPGCPELVNGGGRCNKHANGDRSDEAKEWHKLYDRRWRRYRIAYLQEHPVCADPFGDHGAREVMAECVDHIRPHQGDLDLFWDSENHRPLCIACNSKLAAKEQGGFGNRRNTYGR